MTSYSVFPRQEQPGDQLGVSPRPQSRFVEGSMNDRVSNAPPVDFLGPAEVAAYERQFFLDGNNSSTKMDSTVRQRPISTSGSSALSNSSKKSSFFAPLWDGVREKFIRTKSASSIKTKSSFAGQPEQKEQQQQPEQPRHGSVVETSTSTTPGYYPSREEVMANYKSLVEAGFFSSHAIRGTRHAPPPGSAAAAHQQQQQQHQRQRMEAPLPTPPKLNTAGLPFSQQRITKPAGPRPFASIPYSATQPSRTGDAPKTDYPMPDPRPPLPGVLRNSQKENMLMPPPPLPTSSSPQRGTKRGMADIAGGAAEREATSSTEGGARRLIKKLRKSASHVSADSSRPATSTGTGSSSSSGTGLWSGAFGGSSVSLVTPSAPAVGGRAMGLVRSLSNSFKRDGAGKMTTPTPQPAAVGTNDDLSNFMPTGNRLSKVRKTLGRKASLSRYPASHAHTLSSSSRPPISLHRQAHHLPLPTTTTTTTTTTIPHTDPTPPFPPSPRKSITSNCDDTMQIDSPPPRQSVEVPLSGLSVPSFHYPQRQKLAPLTAAPDANKGIPVMPGTPSQFHNAGRYGKTDGFSFGLSEKEGGGGFVRTRVESIEKENCEGLGVASC